MKLQNEIHIIPIFKNTPNKNKIMVFHGICGAVVKGAFNLSYV